MLHRPIVLLVCLGSAFVAHTAHRALAASQEQAAIQDESTRLALPSGPSLKLLSLGQAVTLADVYWLRFVQHVGNPKVMKARMPQALELAELITDLDPLYGYAYQSAGIVLNSAGRLDESNAILEKGMVHVPKRWQLPFYAAFNHWYERNDLVTGAALLQRAARLPGAPAYVAEMIARLSSAGGRADAAEQYFKELLSTTSEPSVRRRIEERLEQLQIEQDLLLLDDAIARYRLDTGQYPASLDDLVGTRLMALPASPSGQRYRYDPRTGAVAPPDGKRLGRPVQTAVGPHR